MGQDCSDVHMGVPIIISVFITQKEACITNGKKSTRKGYERSNSTKEIPVPRKSQKPNEGEKFKNLSC